MRQIAMILLLYVAAGAAQTQPVKEQPATNEHPRIQQYYMAVLKKGPNWVDLASTPEDSPVRRIAGEHLKRLAGLLENGKAVALGPCDGGDMTGIIIFQIPTEAEARQLAADDPFVKSGYMKAEVHEWWTVPEAFAKAPFSTDLGRHYLVVLLKGPQADAVPKDQLDKLQAAHMANIRKLGDEGKLSVAGPFDGDPKLRGIFVIEAGSEEEARSYVDTDPMIQRGRLAYEIYTWMVPNGLLAKAK